MRVITILCCAIFLLICACNNNTNSTVGSASDENSTFNAYKEKFLDEFWKRNTTWAIYAGYGRYYDSLNIPDSLSFVDAVNFAKSNNDSLKHFDYAKLNAGNKISYRILENQFASTAWYIDTFKSQEWDPSSYNIGGDCYQIITRPFMHIDKRLGILSKRLRHADAYYAAAFKTIKQPMKELAELAIQQNTGSLDVFGQSLTDSIIKSTMKQVEKDSLKARTVRAVAAIKGYIANLQKMLNDNNQVFRDYRIGEKLFAEKFKYDIVTNYSPREIFDKAMEAKKSYYTRMYSLANELWPKYCNNISKPVDSLQLIKTVISKISEHHVSPANLFDTLRQQVYNMKKFIIQKDLFDFDTTAKLEIKKMPSFYAGVTLASARFPAPYDTNSVTFYYITDLKDAPAAAAESQLRENNDYILQILTMHEAMPGHCLQGIYNGKKSPDKVSAVFNNTAMVEGWANYCQKMMLDNGWNNSPEMWLMFYKWSLRECCNVIIDYGIQCLNYSKEDVVNLLKNQAFQEDAQVEEKYHRAVVTQVQLCSYFTGGSEILALREAWKQKEGANYSLKKFHEKFLSYGSAPVKFIREMMMAE